MAVIVTVGPGSSPGRSAQCAWPVRFKLKRNMSSGSQSARAAGKGVDPLQYADVTERAMESARLKRFRPHIAADLEDSAQRRRAAIAAMTQYHREWRVEMAAKEAAKAMVTTAPARHTGVFGSTSMSLRAGSRGKRGSLSQRLAGGAASGAQENVHLQTLLHMAQL